MTIECVSITSHSVKPKSAVDIARVCCSNKSKATIVFVFSTLAIIQRIDIFYEFVKRDHSWELVIIGNGELFDNLQEQIKELDLGDKVKIKPYSHHIEQEYLKASVLLSTSNREGLPMVMIEAMSYGLPVIAYDCKTGPSDIIINRQNGFLIPLDDKEEMLKCMLDIACDDALRFRMSQCAIADSKRFSPESVYPKWDALFEELAH